MSIKMYDTNIYTHTEGEHIAEAPGFRGNIYCKKYSKLYIYVHFCAGKTMA